VYGVTSIVIGVTDGRRDAETRLAIGMQTYPKYANKKIGEVFEIKPPFQTFDKTNAASNNSKFQKNGR
jgi:hypothetical protein